MLRLTVISIPQIHFPPTRKFYVTLSDQLIATYINPQDFGEGNSVFFFSLLNINANK